MEELFYLAKIGEISLKKGNLKDFEMRLSQNLRSYLPEAKPNIRVRAGRMYVSVRPEFKEKAEEALNKLIGITGWAEALPAEKTIEAITETARAEAIRARDAGAKTFKIESRRG